MDEEGSPTASKVTLASSILFKPEKLTMPASVADMTKSAFTFKNPPPSPVKLVESMTQRSSKAPDLLGKPLSGYYFDKFEDKIDP